MSRYIVEIIREAVLAPDTPEYLLMNRSDVIYLLTLTDLAEELASYVENDARIGLKRAKELSEMWKDLYCHEV